MNSVLLGLFAKYMEKQEILSKLTESEELHGYNYSEIHTIAAIGDMEFPNVTGISQAMHMTRGAISKITKRLKQNGLIESYMAEGNNQKIFFKLTNKGLQLYKEHEKRHNLWLERDNAFLQRYSKNELDEIQRFMLDFNNYLEDKIIELGEKKDVD
ncbi:MAG: MarR family transcriptional regulator [Lachnospiraceae bacterium]